MKRGLFVVGALCLLNVSLLFGQESAPESNDTNSEAKVAPVAKENSFEKSVFKNISLSAYGTIVYSNYNWDTDPEKKSEIDLYRFTLEPRFKINDNMFVLAEIEFEHGGTGGALELEEDGSEEAEIEKGGEIVIEQLYLGWKVKKEVNFKFGHVLVPIGWNVKNHKPTESFVTGRSPSEIALLPNLWHQTGVEFFGEFKNFRYQAQIINGLDSSHFETEDFIHEGANTPFETAVAEDFAFVLRCDYGSPKRNHVGASFYIGDTNGNRPTNDLTSSATLTIFDLHGAYSWKGLTARFNYIHFFLSGSEEISVANGEGIGSQAMLFYTEVGYNVLTNLDTSHVLNVFLRYDIYNSMLKTEGSVVEEDGTEHKLVTFGVNYFPNPKVVFKAQYQVDTLNIDGDNKQNTFTLSLGFSI